MNDPTDPAGHLAMAPRSGWRRTAGLLAAVAFLATAAYLVLHVPAQREWHRLARAAHSAFGAGPVALPPPAPAPAAPGSAVDPRVGALADELAALRARVDRIEAAEAARPNPPPAAAPMPAGQAVAMAASDPVASALATRLDAIAARQDRLDAQLVGMLGELKATEAKLTGMAGQSGETSTLARQTGRTASVLAAQAALAMGRPLGTLAGAPPSLARFAQTSPPTLAALRMGFAPLAAKARATEPASSGLGFWAAIKARILSLVTIQRGDRVLIGREDIRTMDAAAEALAAGDLALAADRIGSLTGPQAAIFAPWLDQARALLAAEAALAGMLGAG